MQIGHTENPTVWLYAPAATQKKRYCCKILLQTKTGRLVTDSACQSASQIQSNQIVIYLY